MEGQPVWNADGSGFYYTRVDEHRRPLQVLLHRICHKADQDELIYQEPDAGFFTRVGQARIGTIFSLARAITRRARSASSICPRRRKARSLSHPARRTTIIRRITTKGGSSS